MANKSKARETVCFRLGKSQTAWVDDYCEYYSIGRGDVFREAVQDWLHKQSELHPLPVKEKAE